ncbi:hypothetical protein CEXT_737571 [Caerostris extrusa]|uniref:Uncharacterized protein n=1 Tax=Caerostris extrusa TaxID=172846 RepID=A0AAV4P7X9_CAEEX|nr:hypothetical protein CEXT_737571 [Caerostris extrusa]
MEVDFAENQLIQGRRLCFSVQPHSRELPFHYQGTSEFCLMHKMPPEEFNQYHFLCRTDGEDTFWNRLHSKKFHQPQKVQHSENSGLIFLLLDCECSGAESIPAVNSGCTPPSVRRDLRGCCKHPRELSKQTAAADECSFAKINSKGEKDSSDCFPDTETEINIIETRDGKLR